jgi:hypothetical protein
VRLEVADGAAEGVGGEKTAEARRIVPSEGVVQAGFGIVFLIKPTKM